MVGFDKADVVLLVIIRGVSFINSTVCWLCNFHVPITGLCRGEIALLAQEYIRPIRARAKNGVNLFMIIRDEFRSCSRFIALKYKDILTVSDIYFVAARNLISDYTTA